VFEFQKLLADKLELLKVQPSFASRYVNDGFSGGEKKRNEILQMAVLQPSMAVMDETDSGLDIDALRIVSEGVNTLRGQDGNMGVLLITHYKRILGYLQPDYVHVMLNGRIAHSGGPELADQLEEMGYDWLHEPEPEPVG
jgi:Fe-S cluster assembly ATP-binding protein